MSYLIDMQLKAAKAPQAKALAPADSPQAQIDTLLAKVRFYLGEICDAKDKANSIILAEHHRLHPDMQEDMRDARYCMHMYSLCGAQALWQSIDFALRAVEESFTFRLQRGL